MNLIKDFFENIDFTFGKNINLKEIIISENKRLTDKLKNNVFVYKSENIEQTKSSFYIISSNNLTDKELFEVRRYIWNEDKYDLFFYLENSNIISLNYAKTDPRKPPANIDSFKGKREDEKKLEKIRKWRFETGAFWLSYLEFIEKIKKSERIDEKLIRQLKELKKKLIIELGNDKIEIVQSLIDRTLFIKFLEDNQIINSYFYNHFFNNIDLNYKQLLNNNNAKYINLLFEEINKIFSNVLFDKPHIEEKYINKASNLLYRTISQDDLNTGQLSLFDFRFDIIPIEFISHIYEVFLEDDQLDQGIYYTPPKLAQLIIDDTIAEEGKVLDPACGSGMFLILAFQKLLRKNRPKKNANISEIIKHKIELLQKFIFGIEKDYTAWRLTIFSLYLEILKGLPSEEIKEYIKQKIETENDIKIFPDFSKNVIYGNSLEVKKGSLHFVNQTFDYIIGNPPFFKIPLYTNEHKKERDFIDNYSTEINGKIFKAKDVVGSKQISQAFMLKIKDWANEKTKFGFVLNSSNFYNEKSENFNNFFCENFQIENFYELSRVKKILFKKAKESVIVAIFNNKRVESNIMKYYPVDLELFSETFNLLVIQEDKRIEINQKDILEKKVVLRNYLVGNEFDLELITKLKNNSEILENYILDDNYYGLAVGLRITGSDKIKSENKSYENLSKEEQKIEFTKIKESFISRVKNDTYALPYIEYKDINAFKVFINKFLNKNDLLNNKFRRNKKLPFFKGDKILLRKIPRKKFEAIYDNQTLCFPDGVFSIRLKNSTLYHLFSALLNSDIISYYINLVFLKRKSGSFPHISETIIKNILIPKELDENLVAEISEISQQLTKGKLQYEGKIKAKLNKLIFDLYDLSYLERQRIKDFFSSERTVTKNDFKQYKQTLENMFELYFVNKPYIESHQDEKFGFDIAVVAIYLNKSEAKQPTAEKTLKYIVNEEILKTTNENFLVMQEKIIGNDCIYIIKSNKYSNWTATKAFEDGKNILKSLSK